jgi:hypothetical protein
VAVRVVPQPGAEGDLITFARHNFDTHQALLRFTDTKAGAFLTVVIFLAGSDIPIVKDAVHKLVWQPCSRLRASKRSRIVMRHLLRQTIQILLRATE